MITLKVVFVVPILLGLQVMSKTLIRVPNSYDSDAVSRDNGFACEGESMTRQEFLEESDINTIIAMFGIGENPVTPQKWVNNVDIVDATNDFQSAMNQLVQAANQFNSLPASLRGRFLNDPAKFLTLFLILIIWRRWFVWVLRNRVLRRFLLILIGLSRLLMKLRPELAQFLLDVTVPTDSFFTGGFYV